MSTILSQIIKDGGATQRDLEAAAVIRENPRLPGYKEQVVRIGNVLDVPSWVRDWFISADNWYIEVQKGIMYAVAALPDDA